MTAKVTKGHRQPKGLINIASLAKPISVTNFCHFYGLFKIS